MFDFFMSLGSWSGLDGSGQAVRVICVIFQTILAPWILDSFWTQSADPATAGIRREATLAFLVSCSNVFSSVICICLEGSPRRVGTAESTYDPHPASSLLERSGSLQNDIEGQGLKNDHS